MSSSDSATAAPDASRLSFPTQLVITILSVAVSCALSIFGTTWTLKSDVRDIATRMELRDEKYSDQLKALQDQMSEQKRGLNMVQIDVNELRLQAAADGASNKNQKK